MARKRPNDENNNRDHNEQVTERVRIFLRGKRWYANYQLNGKQMRPPLKTTSKKQARLKALKIDTELEAGEHGPRKKPVAIAVAITAYRDYLEAEDRAPKTLSKYENVFDRMLALASRRKIGFLPHVDLTFLDAYRRQRKNEGAAPKTIHTEVTVVRQVVNFALSRRLIAEDPLKGLKLKRPKPTEQPSWSRDEIRQIMEESNEHYRSILIILAETGMRVGEAKHLTWPDVDFKLGLIYVRAKDDWKPKTGDRRAIPMSPVARAILELLPRKSRWVFTARPTTKFPTADRQISERRLLDHLKRVLKRLGLEGKVHSFRHSFISNALINGTPEAIVRKWVGHVDPEILKLYTHIADQASQAAMQRLSELENNDLHEESQVKNDDEANEESD